MSRLHGALSRATDGKAPILPPDAGVPATPGVESNQSAFTVPWTIDAQAANETPADRAATGNAMLAPQPAGPEIGSSSEVRNKLVGSAESERSGTLALAVEQVPENSPRRCTTPRAAGASSAFSSRARSRARARASRPATSP